MAGSEEAQKTPPTHDPSAGADLWLLPDAEDGEAAEDLPWPVARREGSLDPDAWRAAERAEYRALLAATAPLARLGERLARFPAAERLALESVAALLRGEGIWLGPERIALYRALRVSGAADDAQALARAAWAVRRLATEGQGAGLPGDLRGFLGRQTVRYPAAPPGEERAVGGDLDALGPRLAAAMAHLADCHPLTRGAHAFAWWRTEGVTPWGEMLEPMVAAMRIGAEGLAPFLPMNGPARLERLPGEAEPAARLRLFCAAAEEGALAALMVLDRLERWTERAGAATRDLSGRTPPRLLAALRRLPLVTADLVAAEAGCSAMSARRNLALLAGRGLVREVTGQARFRFWTARI